MELTELASSLVTLEDQMREVDAFADSIRPSLACVVSSIDAVHHASVTVTGAQGQLETFTDDYSAHRLATATRAVFGGPAVDRVSHVVSTDHGTSAFRYDVDKTARSIGIRSLISFPMWLPSASGLAGDISLYFTSLDGADSISAGMLLVVAAALSEALAAGSDSSADVGLLAAMRNHREIGVATGVLMSRYRLAREPAHALLRLCSQVTRQSLTEVATATADRLDVDPRLHAAARGVSFARPL